MESEAEVDRLLAEAEALRESDVRRALMLIEQARAMADRLGYERGRAYSEAYAGFGHYMLSNLQPALEKLSGALARFEAAGDVEGQAEVLGGLASVHTSLGNYEQALQYALHSLAIFRSTGRRLDEAWCLYGIGNGYYAYGDHEAALQYLQESRVLFEEVHDDVGRGRALNGIGGVYQALGRFEEARSYHEQSLALFREAGNRMGEARALDDLGGLCQECGCADEAIAYHRRSLALREEAGNRQAQSTSLIHLGQAYLAWGDLDEALDVLHRALEIAEEVGARPRMHQAHEALAQAYEQRGDVARALAHYKAFHRVREDVLSEEATARVGNLRVLHEVERARREAEIVHLTNVELQGKNERLQQVLQELKATQAQLLQSEKMASLGRLTAGIAHEIKNPLNFVNNFAALTIDLVEELRDVLVHEPERVEELLEDLGMTAHKINEHGQRADSIVQSMLLHARGSGGGERRPVDFAALLREYVNLAYHGMRASVPGFNATIEYDLASLPEPVAVVSQEIGRVVLNLLNNAFYAVYEKAAASDGAYAPTVVVRMRPCDGGVEVRVEDNGNGIPDAWRARIFEPFFTTKPSGTGTGLGLSLSYDIVVHGHGGRLSVESEEGRGATFIMILPQSP